jgi:hypothetical protein
MRGRISSSFDRTYEIAGEGRFFTFERLRHFVLTHFDLSYEASQSGREQPAIHTRVARRFCRSRARCTFADLAPPAVPMGARHFPLRYTARSRRSSFIFLHTCPMMSHFYFRCLTCISFFFTCIKSLLLFKGVVCMNKVVVSSILVLVCACIHSVLYL